MFRLRVVVDVRVPSASPTFFRPFASKVAPAGATEDPMSSARPICHVEIRSRSFEKSSAFYGTVFEWKLQQFMPGYWGIDTGAPPGGGLFVIPDEKVPLGYCNYALVDDAAAMSARAAELGGTITVPKTNIEGMGAFACTIDAWGNELGFWEPADKAQKPPKPQGASKNGFCWVEFSANNLDAAVRYYNQLLGWKFTAHPSTPYAHTEHSGEEIGVGILSGERAAHVRGVTTYIEVEDLATTSAKIKQAGGRIVFGPQEIPGTGSFSLALDAEGTRFAIFKGLSRA